MMKSEGADISCCTSRAGQIQVALGEVAPSLCSGRQQLQLITPLVQRVETFITKKIYRVIIMHGEHYVVHSLNAIYQRRWEVSILASGGEHQSISLHQCE